MKDQIWDRRRQKLQGEAKRAILELFHHTDSAAFMMPLNDVPDGKYISVSIIERTALDQAAAPSPSQTDKQQGEL